MVYALEMQLQPKGQGVRHQAAKSHIDSRSYAPLARPVHSGHNAQNCLSPLARQLPKQLQMQPAQQSHLPFLGQAIGTSHGSLSWQLPGQVLSQSSGLPPRQLPPPTLRRLPGQLPQQLTVSKAARHSHTESNTSAWLSKPCQVSSALQPLTVPSSIRDSSAPSGAALLRPTLMYTAQQVMQRLALCQHAP